MRPLLLAFVLMAGLAASAAEAAPQPPKIAAGASYAAARQALIRHGFSPVPVLTRETGSDCPGGLCRTFPEVLDCSQGLMHCAYLYRDATGAYWQAFSVGEDAAPPYPRIAYAGLRRATPGDLTDVTVEGPDKRPIRLRQPQRPAGPAPQARPGEPYAAARVAIMRQGFEPVRVIRKADPFTCRRNVRLCARYPELTTCTALGADICRFLWRSADGTYFVLVTSDDASRADELAKTTVDEIRLATEADLRNVVVVRPPAGTPPARADQRGGR
jgi:hypothetical protein